jgi:hypothetical protein
VSRGGTPRAIDLRHVGASAILLTCIAGTVIGRQDLTHVLLIWFGAVLYLACCLEPLRRVIRDASVTWALAATFVFATVCCIGFACCLPADADSGPGSFSLASRVVGVDSLSDAGRSGFLTATWLFFAGLVISTLALWYEVLRLARRSEWRAIDHTSGDGSLLTGATLQQPAGGTSVTRPAPPHRGARR